MSNGLFSQQQAPPMFGQGAPPRYMPAINVATGLDPTLDSMVQMAAPYIMPSLLGKQYAQGQFNPQQNLFDQMEAARFYADAQMATTAAAARDQAHLQRVIEGTMRKVSGRELSDAQRQQAFSLSQQGAQLTPMLAQFVGTSTVDQMFGRTGSASMMATGMHMGMRTGRDAVTGQVGSTGPSSGVITSEVFEQLYGRGARPEQMRGVSAGMAGELFAELRARGMATSDGGTLQERLARLPELSEAEMSRMTERVLQQRKAEKRTGYEAPDARTIAGVRQEVQQTVDRIKADPSSITSTELSQMTGGDDTLRIAEARKIGDKLKSMSGVVAAMRDIFGDAGNPNAPMRQLLSTLDALTQGALTTMDPTKVEEIVRRTHALSGQTGMSMEGILGLTTQAAQLTDSNGLVRAQAVLAAQGAAAYGAAAADTQRMDVPMFGAMSQEEVTLLDTQLRVGAAASHTANTAAAVMRMADEGLLNDKGMNGGVAETRLGSYVQALREGKSQFKVLDPVTKTQVFRSVALSHDEAREMAREAGIRGDDFQRFIFDRRGNEQYAVAHDVGTAIRGAQLATDIMPRVANAFDGVIGQRLSDERFGLKDEERARLSRAGGAGAADAFFGMNKETLADATLRNRRLGEAQQRAVREEAIRIGTARGLSGTALNEFAAKLEAGLGDAATLGSVGYAELGTVVATNMPYYNGPAGLWQMHNKRTEAAQRERMRQANNTAALQAAYGGIGRSTFIQRLSDGLADGNLDVGRLLGGVDMAEMAKANPAVAGMMETHKLRAEVESRRAEVRDDSGAVIEVGLSAADKDLSAHLLERVKAFNLGGRYAADYLKANDALPDSDPRKLSKEARVQMGAAEKLGAVSHIQNSGKFDLSSVSVKDLQSTQERAVLAQGAVRALTSGTKLPAEEQAAMREQITGFVDQLGQRADAMLFDPAAVEQLGSGGLGLVRDLSSEHAKLTRMAKQAGVSVADLLEGKVAAEHKPLVEAARASMNTAKERLDAITARKTRSMVPTDTKGMTAAQRRSYDALQKLAGDHGMTAVELLSGDVAAGQEDLVAQGRRLAADFHGVADVAPMSEAEKAELMEEQRFRREVRPEQQAEQVFARLRAEATPAVRALLDSQKSGTLAAIGNGRALDIYRELGARDSLEKLAAAQEFVVDDKGVAIGYEQATEEQRRAGRLGILAAAKAGDPRLDKQTLAEVERLGRTSSRLEVLDAAGNEANVKRLDGSMRQFGTVSASAAAPREKLKVDVTGDVTITDLRATLRLDGMSDPAFTDVPTGDAPSARNIGRTA